MSLISFFFRNSRRTGKTLIQFGSRFNVRLIKSVHLIESSPTVERSVFIWRCRKSYRRGLKIRAMFSSIQKWTKNNLDWFARVFPLCASATCNYLLWWLVHWIVCALCDWLEWLFSLNVMTLKWKLLNGFFLGFRSSKHFTFPPLVFTKLNTLTLKVFHLISFILISHSFLHR